MTYAVVPASAVQKLEVATGKVLNHTAHGVAAVAKKTPDALRVTARGAKAVGGFGFNLTKSVLGGVGKLGGAGVRKIQSMRAKQ